MLYGRAVLSISEVVSWPTMVDVGSSSSPQAARKLGSAGDDVVIRLTHSSLSVPSHGTKFKLIFDERTVLPIAARG